MTLPRFKNLEVYIRNETGDHCPPRFYQTPEQEHLANWKLRIDDTILPVHSHFLCMASPMYCGMAADDVIHDGPIPVPGCSLAAVLALLRFIYRAETLNIQNVGFLLKSGHLLGVLRFAHSIDWSLLEMLVTLTTKAIKNGNATHADIQSLTELSSILKIDALQIACFHAVSTICQKKAHNFEERDMLKAATEIINTVGDSPECLKAALLVMAARTNLDGGRIQNLLQGKSYLPSALFTWTVPAAVMQSQKEQFSKWFSCNKRRYRLTFYPTSKDGNSFVFLEEKNPPSLPESMQPTILWQADFTLRIVHWCDPTASIEHHKIEYFTADSPAWGRYFAKRKELDSFLDPKGNLIIQVVKITMIDQLIMTRQRAPTNAA